VDQEAVSAEAAGERGAGGPVITAEDIVEIYQLLALYGHVADGDLDRLGEVFTDDGTFDARATGGAVHRGVDAIRVFFERVDPPHPPSHHTTNPYVWTEEGRVRALSKWFAIDPATGGLRAGDYSDTLVRTARGWRIQNRTVVCRWWAGPPAETVRPH
jgi:SnoaL-like protein